MSQRPGSFVNTAGILASDTPADVVRKLDAAWEATSTPAAPWVDQHAPCTEAVYSLARKLLWIAYVWNDHNFDHPYQIARKLAQEFGIESVDQANAWLDEQAKLIDACPKSGSEPVATLTIGEIGGEGATQAYFLDRIRDTEAFGKLPPGTYRLAVCSMQATSAEVGS